MTANGATPHRRDAFLAAAVEDARLTRHADLSRPARSGDPVDLTVPEIRRLVGALFRPSITARSAFLHWSNRRRSHHASARRSHYRQRLSAPSSA
jgi:hypothetical protein